MRKEDMARKEKLEIIDELLVEYMKPHSLWKYMEQIQKLLQEIGYPSKTKKPTTAIVD